MPEIIVNYAYNQGFYGGLDNQINTDCISLTSSNFLSKYNSFAATGTNTGNVNTYMQYPYQVRFYLDELYNQSSLQPQTNNHLIFSMPLLSVVFANVFQNLAYINSFNQYVYITASQANSAFNQALSENNVATNAILDLSNTTQRTVIYSILEKAILHLETNLATSFVRTTSTQL